MKQLGLGLHMFTNSHAGRFPETGHTTSWVFTLAPYIENVDTIRICPDDPTGDQRLSSTPRGTSYVISEYISLHNTPGVVRNINKMQETSKSIIVFEGSHKRGLTLIYDHAHPSAWYTPLDIANGTVWQAITNEIAPDRHIDSANYLYADGHVDTVPQETVQQWIDMDIAHGTNFSKPR
jgi:prepilin-type processing-associated H-X9-DG protein